MEKFRDADIRPFEFSDLKGTHVVSGTKLKPFEFEEIDGEPVNAATAPSDETIRQERSHEKVNNFKIEDIVRQYRGLGRQEQADLDAQIQKEVEARLEVAYKKAQEEGMAKGLEEGREAGRKEWEETLDARVAQITEVLEQVNQQSKVQLEQNRAEIYEFIKRFSKWIVLKEIDEKTYLENLLEKLVLELNARKNLIIKVGKANFQQMPEIVQAVENRIGQLSNVRIEIVPELNGPGIVLESENGLIDGSLEGVFANIDKVFEQVTGHE